MSVVGTLSTPTDASSGPLLWLSSRMPLTHRRCCKSDVTLQSVPGRLTLIESAALGELRAPLTGDGYLLRGLAGELAIGATYETALPDDAWKTELSDEQAMAGNLARLSRAPA